MDGRADRPGPRPELGGHDLHVGQRGRQDAPPDLVADRGHQQVAGRRDPAADDDAVRRDDRDHVGDADADVATDAGQALERARVAGGRRLDRGLDGVRPARLGHPVGPGERLQAAVVPAVARGTVRVDRLVADLTRRPVVAEVDAAVDRDDATDPGPQGQPHHRIRPAPGAQPQLGQAERPGVVDQGDREPERRRDRPSDRDADPVAGHVHEEAGRAGDRVVQARDTDPQGLDGRPSSDRRPRGLGDPADDGIGALARVGRDVALAEDPPRLAVVLDGRPLQVGDAEVDPEVMGRDAQAHPASTIRV